MSTRCTCPMASEIYAYPYLACDACLTRWGLPTRAERATSQEERTMATTTMSVGIDCACRCMAYDGDRVTLCPLHASAPEMLYHVRVNAALPCPGRTECGTTYRCDGCRARALLTRLDAR